MLKIQVGSKNSLKIAAARHGFEMYFTEKPEVIGASIPSGVSDQPKSIEETLQGACNRAEAAFTNGFDYGVGLEGGVMQVLNRPYIVSACAVCCKDGLFTGFTPAFRIPDEVGKLVYGEDIGVNEGLQSCGYTSEDEIGASIGAVGLFTGGRIHREEYMKYSVVMALGNALCMKRTQADVGDSSLRSE